MTVYKFLHGGTFRDRAFYLRADNGIVCREHEGVLVPRAALDELDFICDWIVVEWDEPGSFTETRVPFQVAQESRAQGEHVCVPKAAFLEGL